MNSLLANISYMLLEAPRLETANLIEEKLLFGYDPEDGGNQSSKSENVQFPQVTTRSPGETAQTVTTWNSGETAVH